MKIAILTLRPKSNYGGILQTYALQTVLQKMGHDARVLVREKEFDPIEHPWWKWPFVIAKRLMNVMLRRKGATLFVDRSRRRFFTEELPYICKHTQAFVDKYINVFKCESLGSLCESDFDGYVVGSDQIWREPYFVFEWKTNIGDAFFAFTKGWNVKRVAYAPSFGEDEWRCSCPDACRQALGVFDGVSVREDTAVEICRDVLGTLAQHVLDPTLLLEKEHYESLIGASQSDDVQRNLVVYVLDCNEHISALIEQVATLKQMKVVYAIKPEWKDIGVSYLERQLVPVEEWLMAIRTADYVITDSFHGTVFSILFNRQFAVLGNKVRGNARFSSLLKMFGLDNRWVSSCAEIAALPDADWAAVNHTMDGLRKKSLQFLVDSGL